METPKMESPEEKWERRHELSIPELSDAAGQILSMGDVVPSEGPHDLRADVWLTRAQWYLVRIQTKREQQWQAYSTGHPHEAQLFLGDGYGLVPTQNPGTFEIKRVRQTDPFSKMYPTQEGYSEASLKGLTDVLGEKDPFVQQLRAHPALQQAHPLSQCQWMPGCPALHLEEPMTEKQLREAPVLPKAPEGILHVDADVKIYPGIQDHALRLEQERQVSLRQQPDHRYRRPIRDNPQA